MTSLVPFALAWLAAGQLPGGAPPAGEGETGTDSDHLSIDERTGTWTLKGRAVLKTSTIEIRADEMTFDPDQQRAVAKGHVILFQGLLVGFAEEMEVLLTTGEATLVGGTLLRKVNVSPQALLKAKTREELEKMGQTSMAVSGRHVQRVGPDHFLVDGIAFTPCDCDPVKPSWRIRSLHADIIPGERAILTLPVIYIQGVPILAFPWLYLPMSDRRTGLLFPKFGSARGAFFLDQPVFVTLGRSYDLTFTPGYYVGGNAPRLQTEFEYAPAARTSGRATLDLLYDEQPRVDPLTGSLFPKRDPVTGNILLDDKGNQISDTTTRRVLRGAGSLRHLQDLGGGFYDRVDASVASDGSYSRSLSTDLFLRENQYTQSTAVLYRRTAESYAGLDLAVRQDLRFGYGFLDNALNASDFPTHGPNTLARLPELILDAPEARVARYLYGSLRIEYSRLAPLKGGTGIDPVATPSGYVASPLEARDRIDFRPRVSLPLGLGRFARLTPYAWYRQDFYVGESTGATDARGYPLAGAILETELSRVFPTKSGTWRHSVTPSVELRYVPRVFGSRGIRYDEVDNAAPAAGFLQGVAQLSQKLVQTETAGMRRFIRLDLGQGFDVRAGNAADAFARLTAVAAPLNAGLVIRYDMQRKRLAQFSANLAFADSKGLGLSAQYDNLLLTGSDALRRGIDELVGPPVVTAPSPFERAQTVTAHAGFRFKFGLAIAYDLLVSPTIDSRCALPEPPSLCFADVDRTTPKFPTPAPWTIRQQTLTLSVNPSCDCWRLDLRALVTRQFILPEFYGIGAPLTPDLGVTFTIAKFGSFGL